MEPKGIHPLLALMAFAFGLFLAWAVTFGYMNAEWQSEAVKMGHAEYTATPAGYPKWTWKHCSK